MLCAERREGVVRAETYVVRIYRRARENGGDVAGVVEAVRTGRQQPFHNLRELTDILAGRGRSSAPRVLQKRFPGQLSSHEPPTVRYPGGSDEWDANFQTRIIAQAGTNTVLVKGCSFGAEQVGFLQMTVKVTGRFIDNP